MRMTPRPTNTSLEDLFRSARSAGRLGLLCLAAVVVLAGSAGAESRDEKAGAAAPEPLPTIAEKTAGLERADGLLASYLDADRGVLWLELPPAGAGGEVGRYLYAVSLVHGLGSNPVGLDRGQIGINEVVRLRRVGGRLLIEALNSRYVAASDDPDERRAVAESFATSVLWAGPVAAEDPDGRFLVDLTPFVVRDAHRVAATLRRTGQGAYAFDPERGALDPEACLSFPDNLELEAVLTWGFSGDEEPGEHVRETAPVPESITLRQRQSLVRLPDDGYRPRAFHPESGYWALTAADYAAPLDQPIERRLIVRHRLQKRDPEAASSPVVEPIVFYLDPGIPEPVRSALAEGAGWWAQAFAAAGFEDAFRVEPLPPGAHPLDVRYNVIQWVHRSTRGWSYGGGVIDPRTGELIKGHVNLGSLRVRQDRLLFEGLLGTDETGTGAPDDPVQLALARLRQLAAHEVGHALGLAHNFAASSYGRASVMDYPAPRVRIGDDGLLDVSEAYGEGVGAWDLHAIRYGYAEFPADEEDERLAAILAEGRERGLLNLGNADAREPGTGNPRASLWDDGADPVAALEEVLAVRRHALARFGERNVRPGRPLAALQETLAPVYLYHRYQLEAAAKLIGGFDYRYAHRGDGADGALTPVPGDDQLRALAAILTTLDPAALDLPEDLLRLLLPRPLEYPPHRELFQGATDPGFDPLAAAAGAARLTLESVLQPQRAARLVDFHRRDPELPGLGEVIDSVLATAFPAPTGGPSPGSAADSAADARHAEILRTVQWTTASALIDLAADAPSPAVRSRTEGALRRLADRLATDAAAPADPIEADHRRALAAAIERFLTRPATPAERAPAAPEPPPGPPIGGWGMRCSAGVG